ncbi:MAG: alpha/beta hydrolase family protein [Myxococcota bacterium]|nr:alpha/beta hydrolase family protein [Myxococcota bacterium]
MATRFPHPDDLVGALSGVAHVLRPRSRNTIDALRSYEGMDVEALFAAPADPPRGVRVKRRWRLPGLVSEDVSFPSPYEPIEAGFRERYERRYVESHTVWARRLRPEGAEGRPRLLYLHGYMQPETLVEELGLVALLARRLDVEIVQMQPPYHGRRKPRRSWFDGDLYWTGDVVRSVEALRQTLVDARALLSWMRAESDRPVGVSGLSLGGLLSCALTCLDDRFAFSLPLIAHMDIGAVVEDAPVLGRMRSELRAFGWEPRDFGRFFDRIGWNRQRAQLPPDRIRLFAASQDRFFDPGLVESLARQWGGAPIEWYECSHMGFVPRLPRAAESMRAVIDAVGS